MNKPIKDINNKNEHLKNDCKLYDSNEGGDLTITTVTASCKNCGVVQQDDDFYDF